MAPRVPNSRSRSRQRRSVQLALPKTAGWGGRRKGSGRKKQPGAGLTHLRRSRFKNAAIHVTLRVRPHVYNLRSRRCFRALASRAFSVARDRFGMRLCHFGVEGNHLHLIVEATDAAALSKGMHAITIRMARALNGVMQRRGSVFADRYHAHVLRTPTELRNAVRYAVGNHAIHARRLGRPVSYAPDLFSSLGYPALGLFHEGELTVLPVTFLLRKAMAP